MRVVHVGTRKKLVAHGRANNGFRLDRCHDS